MNDIIIYLIISFLSSLNSYLEKIGIKIVNPYNFRFYKNIVVGIISLFIYLFLYYSSFSKENKISLKSIDTKSILILLCSSVFSIITGLCVYYLFNKKFVSEVIPLSISFSIVVTALVGYFFFSENLNFSKVVGIIVCVMGILLIKISNDNNKK